MTNKQFSLDLPTNEQALRAVSAAEAVSLRLADLLDERAAELRHSEFMEDAAVELRRLYRVNLDLMTALSGAARAFEKARIWGGMEWVYNILHPMHYKPALEETRAAIKRASV
jgi:hypothetical protein